MKEFAAAAETRAAAAEPEQIAEDPLADLADSAKIISEVESLTTEHQPEVTEASTGSALEESLDTEKLLAEVDSLKSAQKKASDEDDIFATFDKAGQG
jgi:hypothetical protein